MLHLIPTPKTLVEIPVSLKKKELSLACAFTDARLQKAAEKIGMETFSSPTTSDWMRITCDAVKMGPGESSRSHRRNEFVFTDEIRNGIEKYIEFINNL